MRCCDAESVVAVLPPCDNYCPETGRVNDLVCALHRVLFGLSVWTGLIR